MGRYVEAIVPALAEAGVDLTVIAKRADAADFERMGVRVVVAPSLVDRRLGRFAWEQFGLPRAARRVGADVVHSIHYTFPLVLRPARVVGVHDLTFFTHPELHSRLKGPFFRWWIRRAATSKATVIVPSAATGREYTRVTGAPEESVHVALHGYDANVFHPPTREQSAEFGDRFRAESGWISFLGTLEPRKNVPALVDGYVAAMRTVPTADRLPLLLAGGPGWDAGVEPAVARAVDGGFDVRLLGYVDRRDLSVLLGGAELVAYPSLGEGFGLPVLEAMATGAIVVTTDRLAIPEVGGEAVVYAAPDARSIGVEIARVLAMSDEDRGRLRSLALDRAKGFTWTRCALQHVRAYSAAS